MTLKLFEFVSHYDLAEIEKHADYWFAKAGIDVEFTRHFIDRLNSERGGQPVTAEELMLLFRLESQRWGRQIFRMGARAEGVLRDMHSDINVPFALQWNEADQQLELVAKTVLRKKDFRSPDQVFPVDSKDEAVYVPEAVAAATDRALVQHAGLDARQLQEEVLAGDDFQASVLRLIDSVRFYKRQVLEKVEQGEIRDIDPRVVLMRNKAMIDNPHARNSMEAFIKYMQMDHDLDNSHMDRLDRQYRRLEREIGSNDKDIDKLEAKVDRMADALKQTFLVIQQQNPGQRGRFEAAEPAGDILEGLDDEIAAQLAAMEAAEMELTAPVQERSAKKPEYSTKSTLSKADSLSDRDRKKVIRKFEQLEGGYREDEMEAELQAEFGIGVEDMHKIWREHRREQEEKYGRRRRHAAKNHPRGRKHPDRMEVDESAAVTEDEFAEACGIVDKENATCDVPVGGEYMNVKGVGIDASQLPCDEKGRLKRKRRKKTKESAGEIIAEIFVPDDLKPWDHNADDNLVLRALVPGETTPNGEKRLGSAYLFHYKQDARAVHEDGGYSQQWRATFEHTDNQHYDVEQKFGRGDKAAGVLTVHHAADGEVIGATVNIGNLAGDEFDDFETARAAFEKEATRLRNNQVMWQANHRGGHIMDSKQVDERNIGVEAPADRLARLQAELDRLRMHVRYERFPSVLHTRIEKKEREIADLKMRMQSPQAEPVAAKGRLADSKPSGYRGPTGRPLFYFESLGDECLLLQASEQIPGGDWHPLPPAAALRTHGRERMAEALRQPGAPAATRKSGQFVAEKAAPWVKKAAGGNAVREKEAEIWNLEAALRKARVRGEDESYMRSLRSDLRIAELEMAKLNNDMRGLAGAVGKLDRAAADRAAQNAPHIDRLRNATDSVRRMADGMAMREEANESYRAFCEAFAADDVAEGFSGFHPVLGYSPHPARDDQVFQAGPVTVKAGDWVAVSGNPDECIGQLVSTDDRGGGMVKSHIDRPGKMARGSQKEWPLHHLVKAPRPPEAEAGFLDAQLGGTPPREMAA